MKYFDIMFERHLDKSFMFAVTPIWIHRHYKDWPLHFHIVINLGLWFLEIRIGKEFNADKEE